MPFEGDTQAVVFDAILNRDPRPLAELNPALPPALGQILGQGAREGPQPPLPDRDRAEDRPAAPEARPRVGRSGARPSSPTRERRAEGPAEKLGRRALLRESRGVEGRRVLPRRDHRGHHHRAVEDQGAEDVLAARRCSPTATSRWRPRRSASSSRRPACSPAASAAPATGCGSAPSSSTRGPTLSLWSRALRPRDGGRLRGAGRDRAQDRRGAAVTLSPQEQEAIAAKPTENRRPTTSTCAAGATRGAWRGRTSSSRSRCSRTRWRRTRASRSPTPRSRTSAPSTTTTSSARPTLARARPRGGARRRSRSQPDLPEAQVGAGLDPLRRAASTTRRCAIVRSVDRAQARHARAPTTCSLRALFASGRYQEIANVAEEAIEASGTDYNVYVPIMNALGALGKHEAAKNVRQRRDPGARGPPPRGARGRPRADPARRATTPPRAASTTPCARRTSPWCCGRTTRTCTTTRPALSAR